MNQYKQSLYTGIIKIFANLVMVAAIFIAMRLASRQIAWSSEIVFCVVFFGITIPCWIFAHYLIKWIKKIWPAEDMTMVELPKRGNQLVSWSVVKTQAISLKKSI